MRKIKILLLMIPLMFISVVYAEKSSYYQHIWTNETSDSTSYVGYVTNDIIKVKDGYLTAGFKYEEAKISILDESGATKKMVSFDGEIYGRLKRIFAVDGGYVAIGTYLEDVFAIRLDSNYNYLDTNYIDVGREFDWAEVYAIESDGKIYLFNSEYYDDAIIVYDIQADLFTSNVSLNSIPSKVRTILNNYFDIINYDNCYSGTDEHYCHVFIKPYNNGYVFGLYDWDEENSKIVYFKDQEMWQKTYDNKMIKDGTVIGDYFVLAVNDGDAGSYLMLIDNEGNQLENISINEYTNNDYPFIPEHLINVDGGFALTGSVYTCGVSDRNINNDVVDITGSTIAQKSAPLKSVGEEPPEKPDGDLKPGGDKKPGDDKKTSDDKKTDNYKASSATKKIESKVIANCYSDKVLYFLYNFKIETKTDGHGTVEANKRRAMGGEVIDFTIIPDDGYVLAEVKVTDAGGNIIIFTDNKFSMPAADVLIEATFVKTSINPETSAGIGIVVLAIIGLISGFYVIKQIKTLKI